MVNLSLVIPVYNEEENIRPLMESLAKNLDGIDHEVIFVDDGSSDHTVDEIIKRSSENVRVLVFSRNFGQTSALAAGIDAAKGEFIATLDGDLQNDPADIPMMLERLQKDNLDIVAGRRLNRRDGMLLRKIPSKIANFLIRKVTKVKVHDYGCTLKIFRASLAKKLDLYGELHRFIPILGSIHGAKIAEMYVRHHPRKFGQSKYGIGRTLKVASDLLLMFFFVKYRQKPMHLFGMLGLGMFGGGFLIETWLLLEKIAGQSVANRPLFYIGILLIIMSIQFITTGFVAELIMRTYFGATSRKPYSIHKKYQAGRELHKKLKNSKGITT